ncbi:MAG: bifunctional nuclease family protein [Phycisphaerales bacterium]|nr:bifunctional nuclease family protein [Phycisphaerales bacterium]
MEVRCDLARIIIFEYRDQQVIMLRERGGARVLQIVIGSSEALAIDRRLKGITLERPQTHELLAGVIESLGAEVEKIVITELRRGTFFARIVLRRSGEVVEIDSRPSDAIALAAGLETPIYVSEQVLREAATAP